MKAFPAEKVLELIGLKFVSVGFSAVISSPSLTSTSFNLSATASASQKVKEGGSFQPNQQAPRSSIAP
jgi:hypothetical protein